MLSISDLITFFKDIKLISVSSYFWATELPYELQNNAEKMLFFYKLSIENHSNLTINKIAIKYKFKTKYKPVIYDQEGNEYELLEEKNTLVINDLLPHNKLVIIIYLDVSDEYYKIQPTVYFDGNLLSWKSKLISSLLKFFKNKYNFLLLFFIIVPLLVLMYVKNTIYVEQADINQSSLKSEVINQKMFNYYKRQGFKPFLSKMDIINTPVGFYEQEKLKKTIRANCDEKFILAVNAVESLDELFKLKQIMICE